MDLKGIVEPRIPDWAMGFEVPGLQPQRGFMELWRIGEPTPLMCEAVTRLRDRASDFQPGESSQMLLDRLQLSIGLAKLNWPPHINLFAVGLDQACAIRMRLPSNSLAADHPELIDDVDVAIRAMAGNVYVTHKIRLPGWLRRSV